MFARVVGGLRPPPPQPGLRRGLRPLLGPVKRGFVWALARGTEEFFSPVALASAIMRMASGKSLQTTCDRANMRFIIEIYIFVSILTAATI